MPKIMPITDLRDTTGVSNMCHSLNEPIYITKNGYGDMVIMSMDTFDKMTEALKIDNAIMSTEKQFAEDRKAANAQEVFSILRRIHFE